MVEVLEMRMTERNGGRGSLKRYIEPNKKKLTPSERSKTYIEATGQTLAGDLNFP